MLEQHLFWEHFGEVFSLPESCLHYIVKIRCLQPYLGKAQNQLYWIFFVLNLLNQNLSGSERDRVQSTPPKFNIAPEKSWFED